MNKVLTVGVATRNRASEVLRCIQSICLIQKIVCEIIVIDDGSDSSVQSYVEPQLASDLLSSVSFIRWETSQNYMTARNEIVRRARAELVLILDDDAYLVSGHEVEQAVKHIYNDSSIGSIAFPECEASGDRKAKQPGTGSRPCYTTHFYGYAHIVRRDSFLFVGGYRPIFGFYHEESDLCKRLLNANLRCVYWPEAKIAHLPSMVDRADRGLRRFRQGMRNRCLDATFNEPFPLASLTVLILAIRYFLAEPSFAKRFGRQATGGRTWLLRELWSLRKEIRHERSPLSWRVFIEWRWLRLRQPVLKIGDQYQ